MRLTTITVRGVEFEVSIDERTGVFSTAFDGRPISAPSLADLTEKLTRATKSVKIAIEFATLRDRKVLRGTCTGKHASNKNLLVRWEDGTSEQLDSWDLKACVSPDAETVGKYQALSNAVAAALEARDKFVAAHRVNVKAMVDAALENAWKEKDGGAA